MANNWTYGVYDPDANEVKWGRSVNPFDRLKSFKADRPNCQLVVILPDHSVEYELHAMFDEKRHEGEWFEADDEMLAFIEQARIWTPQPPRVLVDVPAPQVVEVKVPTPFVVQPEPAVEPEPEPEPEPEDEGWHQTPKMDIYIGVFFVAMATLMIAGTVVALASSGWRVDLNTGRWMLSYPFMFGVGIHLIKRSVAKLTADA